MTNVSLICWNTSSNWIASSVVVALFQKLKRISLGNLTNILQTMIRSYNYWPVEVGRREWLLLAGEEVKEKIYKKKKIYDRAWENFKWFELEFQILEWNLKNQIGRNPEFQIQIPHFPKTVDLIQFQHFKWKASFQTGY